MPAAGLAKVGVEAVVGGLSSFLGDMGKVDGSIKNLVGSGNLVSRAFSSLGDVVSGLIGSVFRVLEYTLGNLIAGAIRDVIENIKEFISESLELANTLARLQVRLDGLNMPQNANDVTDWTAAMEDATAATKEQMDWLQKLAVAAPFPPDQIADIYTAARSMGYADEAARDLTKDILEFAAGMGLSSTEAERIIVNLRQMGTRGKVTGREMADLARGALLPLDDVLGRMAKNMGISVEELNSLISSAEGVDPQLFVTAFQQMVNEEPRFIGAMGRLGRTFEFATKNFKEFLANLGAKNIIMPVLDALGERIASITDQFVRFNEQGELIHTEKWEAAVSAATRVGEALVDIISGLIGVGPTAEEIADGIVAALDGIADWLENNKDGIIKWVQDSARWVRDELVPALERAWTFLFGEGTQKGAIQKFGEWLQNDLIPLVEQQVLPVLADLNEMLFGEKKAENASGSPDDRTGALPADDLATSVSEIDNTPLQNLLKIFQDLQPAITPLIDLLGALGGVLIVAFGGSETEDFGVFVRDTLVPALTDLATWVSENKELLAGLLKAFLAMQVILFLVGIVISIVGAFITFGGVAGIIGIVMLAIDNFKRAITLWGQVVAAQIWFVFRKFMEWKGNVARIFNEVMDAIKNKDWEGVGRALVDGIWRGIQNNWSQILELARSLGQAALNAFNDVFNIHSPSQEMWNIGENIVAGLAQGIKDSTGMAVESMQKMAVATLNPMVQMSMKAMPGTTSTTVNNNYNLNVNTSARAEPIVADFAMLETLAV